MGTLVLKTPKSVKIDDAMLGSESRAKRGPLTMLPQCPPWLYKMAQEADERRKKEREEAGEIDLVEADKALDEQLAKARQKALKLSIGLNPLNITNGKVPVQEDSPYFL